MNTTWHLHIHGSENYVTNTVATLLFNPNGAGSDHSVAHIFVHTVAHTIVHIVAHTCMIRVWASSLALSSCGTQAALVAILQVNTNLRDQQPATTPSNTTKPTAHPKEYARRMPTRDVELLHVILCLCLQNGLSNSGMGIVVGLASFGLVS